MQNTFHSIYEIDDSSFMAGATMLNVIMLSLHAHSFKKTEWNDN